MVPVNGLSVPETCDCTSHVGTELITELCRAYEHDIGARLDRLTSEST